ncbi:unnamed protein product [Camellia sinensis]
MAKNSPESDTTDQNFNETELTLGLPGESRNQKSGTKRGFLETVDLKVKSRGKIFEDDQSENQIFEVEAKPSTEKTHVVGWPPVRSFRKNTIKKRKYVKVAVDGAPYLRKVDLEMYNSYQQLLTSLKDMFNCFSICNYLDDERKLMDPVNGSEYVPTYEDKDGDWMLVGDVPWKMFVESCKRLRLMKSSEPIGRQGHLQNAQAQVEEEALTLAYILELIIAWTGQRLLYFLLLRSFRYKKEIRKHDTDLPLISAIYLFVVIHFD